MLRSPSGKLVQIEHALTAVGSGQTSLGIKGNVAAPGFYLKLVRARVYRLCDLMGELVFSLCSPPLNAQVVKHSPSIVPDFQLLPSIWPYLYCYMLYLQFDSHNLFRCVAPFIYFI